MQEYKYLRDALDAALRDRETNPARLVSVRDLIDGELLAVATHKTATERWLAERREGGELQWSITTPDPFEPEARARVGKAARALEYLHLLAAEAE